MQTRFQAFVLLSAMGFSAFSSFAKDTPISSAQCPPPVQAVLNHYSTQATLESVALDEKKKSGGPAVYEATFNTRDGKRMEVHISPEGRVIQFEEKKPKS